MSNHLLETYEQISFLRNMVSAQISITCSSKDAAHITHNRCTLSAIVFVRRGNLFLVNLFQIFLSIQLYKLVFLRPSARNNISLFFDIDTISHWSHYSNYFFFRAFINLHTRLRALRWILTSTSPCPSPLYLFANQSSTHQAVLRRLYLSADTENEKSHTDADFDDNNATGTKRITDAGKGAGCLKY